MDGAQASKLAAAYFHMSALRSAADIPCLLMPSPELDSSRLCWKSFYSDFHINQSSRT